MLEKIRAIFCVKTVFLNLKEVKKLKIVKYNKSLQNILNIKLINYKYFTGRYIIYEPNGKGKEFDAFDDNLVFEGEYLKGERNGKGKEYYYNGKLEFDGEYLNGERNGKGKEYYSNGHKLKGKEYINETLEFEGEYLHDKKWNGKWYDESGNLIYELNNGNGKGKENPLFLILFPHQNFIF